MKFEAKYNEIWKSIHEKKRYCMYKDCQETAIKSHVLQKNGILNQIAEDNHLIELVPANAFDFKNTGINQFKRIGVNDAYTFLGFCNKHDTEIFRPIEKRDELNLYLPQHQALFSYRGLCQEIRRKETALEMAKYVNDNLLRLEGEGLALMDGFRQGIKNLMFFKYELEEAIEKCNFDNFVFTTVEIPKIDLCISVPLNIGATENPLNLPYEEWKKSLKFPYKTSFINIFPLKNKSYFMGGYHKKYPCKWTEKKLKKINRSKNKIIKKELSDLIVLRLEFWLMSQKLFRSISDYKIKEYRKIFTDNIYNHNSDLKTKLNLFKKF